MTTLQIITAELQGKRRTSVSDASSDEFVFFNSGILINITGRTLLGESVRVCVAGHCHVFYASVGFHELTSVVALYNPRFSDDWIEERSVVHRQIYQGFRGSATSHLHTFAATSLACIYAVRKAVEAENDRRRNDDDREDQIETFNLNIDPLCAYFHASGVRPGSWARIEASLDIEMELVKAYDTSNCDIDVVVAADGGLVAVAGMDGQVAPFRILTYDIECTSSRDQNGDYLFPSPDMHAISCICGVVRCGDAPLRDVAFAFQPCDRARFDELAAVEIVDARTEVHVFGSETDMLMAFMSWFHAEDIDVLMGYNILGFDNNYIFRRCEALEIDVRGMGRWMVASRPKLIEKELDTAGAGFNVFRYWDIAGVLVIDELVSVRRDVSLKLPSYSLNSVAMHYFNESKMDLPPRKIFEYTERGGAAFSEVLVYCCVDARLTDKLSHARKSFLNTLLFARVTIVPPSYVQLRGANVKSLSLIAAKASTKGWVISDAWKRYNRVEGKYSGATVLDPVVGLHKRPVIVSDFASLYPSIMISQNLDAATYVEDPTYLGLAGFDYKTFSWVDGEHRFTHTFVTNAPSIIPELELELKDERGKAKAAMRCASTDLERAVFDALQNAVKVAANSLYGFFGAVRTNYAACLPVAATITYYGRFLIEQTQVYLLATRGRFIASSDAGVASVDERLDLPLATLQLGLAGGIRIVYGDTDSVFYTPDDVDAAADETTASMMRSCIAYGEAASREVTAFLNARFCPVVGVVSLEFEKVLFWSYFVIKKNYAGAYWTRPDKPDKLLFKGLPIVRRDYITFTRVLLKVVLDLVLIGHDEDGARRFFCREIERFIAGDVTLEELMLTGSPRPPPKSKTVSAPMAVARKRRERGLEVPDRVSWVFLMGAKDAKQSEIAEDPEWIRDNASSARISFDYYWAHKLVKPVDVVLGKLLPDVCSASSVFMREAHGCLMRRLRNDIVDGRASAKRQSTIRGWLTGAPAAGPPPLPHTSLEFEEEDAGGE